MSRGRWNRGDVARDQLWLRKGASESVLTRPPDELFRVVAICDEPTVTLEDLRTGKRETHAITSLNFSAFRRLDERVP